MSNERETGSDARSKIHNLKAQYFRYLDSKDFEGLDRLFLDDALIDVRGAVSDDGERDAVGGFEDGVMSGAEFKQFLRATMPPLTSVHHGHMGEIEIIDERSARAVWAMEDRVWFGPDNPIEELNGWGHYHESYTRCDDGHWRIQTMKLTRIKVILTERGAH